MKSLHKYLYIAVIGLGILLITTPLNAQVIKPHFDANEVINRVNHNHYFTESRQGEFLLDTNLVYVPAGAYQGQPAIAFDGTNYLVVWCDERPGYNCGIFGVRVNPSGIILDSAGIVISTTLSWKNFPSVTFNGTNYLVVWDDDRQGEFGRDIYGVRVSPEGIVLDPDGIAISTATNWECDPGVASDGTNYFVVWADQRTGSFDIYGARVSPSGTVLDPDGIAISTASGIQGDADVVFDGNNYFVVWDDNRNYGYNQADIYGARVNPAGIVLDPDGIAISTETNDQMCPAVAFDGINYLVAWPDMRSGLFDIYCARVNQSGVLIDTAGIFINSTGSTWQWFISVAFDGMNYIVVWQDNISTGMDVYGARVTPSGVVLDTAGIPISTEVDWQYEPAIASDGTNSLVVWCDGRRFLGADIYGARLNQAGTVLDPDGIVISSSANYQDYSSSAFDGSNYFVVWQDDQNIENIDIYGTRVNQSGSILDPSGISISTANCHQTKPSVAFDNTNYLVVWENYQIDLLPDIYGARVDQSGVVLDTAGIPISTTPGGKLCTPAVAFGNTNYLIVWADLNVTEIHGARINQSGVVLDPAGIAIATAGVLWRPSVGFDNTNYLVVWRKGGCNAGDIYGTRINQSGIVIDTNNIAISTAPNIQDAPSVGFDGVNYLVVWGDNRTGDGGDIYGARVSPSGIILDTAGIPISTAKNTQCEPFVAFNGTDYVIVWQDNRNSPFFDLYGAKVNTSGAVIDSFVVALESGYQFRPAIAHGQEDQILITYSGWTDYINSHSAHTYRIWGKFYPFVGVEETTLRLMPHALRLLQIYPNPTKGNLKIRFSSPDEQKITIKLYDVSGRLINEIFNGKAKIGMNEMSIMAANYVAGIYFISIESDKKIITEKFIMLK